jgi:microcystin-dependent protein
MAGTNQYPAFATGGGANVLSPSAWNSLTALRANGFQTGTAESIQVNTAIRHGVFGTAVLAKIISDSNANALDDGNLATFAAALRAAFGVPSGSVMAYMSNTGLPAGWLECNGANVQQSAYPGLFAAIGSVYNDGGTPGGYFKLPDLRGEFLRGWDNGRGVDPSRGFPSSQADALKAHTHGLNFDLYDENGVTINHIASGGPNLPIDTTFTGTTGSTGTTETRPRNVAVVYMIKT